MADSLVEHDVELSLAERRRHFVLHDLDAHVVADHYVAFFHGADAPHVQSHRRVELERPAARRRFGVAEHDADLLAQLIDEDHRGARAVDRPGELAQRLAHEPGLQAGQRVAHLPFDFGFGHERRD